jgi:hypothetical protein
VSTTSSDSDGITNLMILQYMQNMELGLRKEIKGVHGEIHGLGKRMLHFENRMDGLNHSMNEGFSESNRRLNSIDAALQRLYVHRVSMLGRIEKLEEMVGIAQ